MSDAFASRSSSSTFGTGGDEGRSDYGRGSSFESGTGRRSAAGIQQDAEATRSGIGDTISELRERFSPENAIQYGTDYMRGPGGQRLLSAARENPMAAALTLAGIGWLLYTANRGSSASRSRGGFSQGNTSSRSTDATSYGQTSGIMGDGTQEQNLNQTGQAGSRITRDEVQDAFGSGSSSDTSLR